ncbi:MAG: hypothetical protein ACHQUC_05455, partial [Chlamydiales bacterium]
VSMNIFERIVANIALCFGIDLVKRKLHANSIIYVSEDASNPKKDGASEIDTSSSEYKIMNDDARLYKLLSKTPENECFEQEPDDLQLSKDIANSMMTFLETVKIQPGEQCKSFSLNELRSSRLPRARDCGGCYLREALWILLLEKKITWIGQTERDEVQHCYKFGIDSYPPQDPKINVVTRETLLQMEAE